MTDPKQDEKAGAGNSNPAGGDEPKPTPQPAANPTNAEAQLKALEAKIEELGRQYKGSSEEALRLAQENEALKKQLDSMKSGNADDIDEGDFQKLVDKVGLKKAIEQTLGPKIAALENELKGVVKEKAEEMLAKFEASHVGLKHADVKTRFEAELGHLKKVFDITTAMEKAYLLAGGKEAETRTAAPVEDPNKEKVVSSAAGGEVDARPAPIKNTDDLQKQINDLTYQAHLMERQGKSQSAVSIYTRIEELKVQLKSKV